MKIQLDLTTHCIETELKRLHNRILSRYFKLKSENASLEEQMEYIGKALKTLDFPFLRSRFPNLAGRSDKEVLLTVDEKGEMGIQVGGKKINLHQDSS
jgi:hypothetical protein